MVMIREQICELFQRKIAGGTPSDDFEPTVTEINYWLIGAIAMAAKGSYWENANDGYDYVADGYYTTFKNIAIAKDDDTGFYTATLPSLPVGVPFGWDISKAYLKSAEGKIDLVRIARNRTGFYNKIPYLKTRTAFWTDNATIQIDCPVILIPSDHTLFVTMVAASGSLSDTIAIDEGMLDKIFDFLTKNLMPEAQIPQDVSNDSVKN